MPHTGSITAVSLFGAAELPVPQQLEFAAGLAVSLQQEEVGAPFVAGSADPLGWWAGLRILDLNRSLVMLVSARVS